MIEVSAMPRVSADPISTGATETADVANALRPTNSCRADAGGIKRGQHDVDAAIGAQHEESAQRQQRHQHGARRCCKHLAHGKQQHRRETQERNQRPVAPQRSISSPTPSAAMMPPSEKIEIDSAANCRSRPTSTSSVGNHDVRQ